MDLETSRKRITRFGRVYKVTRIYSDYGSLDNATIMDTNDTKNEDGIMEEIDQQTNNRELNRSKFEKDGFVVIRGLVPLNTLQEWQAFCDGVPGHHQDDTTGHNETIRKPVTILEWIHQELYARGHTLFPEEYRVRTSEIDDADKQEGSSNSRTDQLQKDYAMGQGIKHGFREVVMRSPGRYEISLLQPQSELLYLRSEAHEEDAESDDIPNVDKLYQVLDDQGIASFLSPASSSSPLTWEDARVCNLSLVISTPGAEEQKWHADGGHVDLQQHLPCHVLNVFVALHDVPTLEWGPTQLRPGTHVHTRNLGPLLLAAHCQKTLQPPVAPLLQAGDALVFDYRILHRGLANQNRGSSEPRTESGLHHYSQNRSMLVITVAQEWFRDRLNFPSRSLFEAKDTQTKGRDAS